MNQILNRNIRKNQKLSWFKIFSRTNRIRDSTVELNWTAVLSTHPESVESHVMQCISFETFWAPIISPYGFSTYLSWYWIATCSIHIYVWSGCFSKAYKTQATIIQDLFTSILLSKSPFSLETTGGNRLLPGYFLPLRLHKDLEGSLQSTDLVSNFVMRFQNNHILLLYRWEFWDNCSSHKTWILQKTLTLINPLQLCTPFPSSELSSCSCFGFPLGKGCSITTVPPWTARWIVISGRAAGNKAVSVVDSVDLTEFPWTWLGLFFSKSCF